MLVNVSLKSRSQEDEDGSPPPHCSILSLGLFCDASVCFLIFQISFSVTFVCSIEDLEQNAVVNVPSCYLRLHEFLPFWWNQGQSPMLVFEVPLVLALL